MGTLFIYDGGIIKKGNSYYTDIFGNELVERYSFFKQEVEYLMREREFKVGDDQKYSEITHKNFKFTGISNACSIKGLTVDSFKINRLIKERVKNNNIIIIRLPGFAGIKAIKECQRQKKPYLVELVGCPWDAFWNHSLKGKIVAPFLYFATKKRVKDAPYVIYVTNEFLQKRYPTKGKNINCSNVTLKTFDNTVLEKRLNKISSLTEDRKLIIGTTAAVNVKYKGQQYIIEALGKLKKEGVMNFEYQLVGAGDQTYLKGLAERYNVINQVKFLGPLPHPKVFDWLDTIDLYVQPSRQEGLPRALIEAMSRGLPAFGAKTAGIPELLDDDYIFSNTKQNINEICAILKKFGKEAMINQSKRNYNEAKKYDKSLIDARRKEFYSEFLRDYTRECTSTEP